MRKVRSNSPASSVSRSIQVLGGAQTFQGPAQGKLGPRDGHRRLQLRLQFWSTRPNVRLGASDGGDHEQDDKNRASCHVVATVSEWTRSPRTVPRQWKYGTRA